MNRMNASLKFSLRNKNTLEVLDENSAIIDSNYALYTITVTLEPGKYVGMVEIGDEILGITKVEIIDNDSSDKPADEKYF